jgi:hypothetical protein
MRLFGIHRRRQLCRKLHEPDRWTARAPRAMVGVCEAYMSDKRAMEAGAVSFSERLANSQVFATLFRDGQSLDE